MTRDLDDVCLQRHTPLKGGAYRIEERLASSELSIVYIGSPAEGEGKLAIKEFYPGSLALRDMDGKTVLCRRPSIRRKFDGLNDAFRREASVLSRLRHRHIVEYRLFIDFRRRLAGTAGFRFGRFARRAGRPPDYCAAGFTRWSCTRRRPGKGENPSVQRQNHEPQGRPAAVGHDPMRTCRPGAQKMPVAKSA